MTSIAAAERNGEGMEKNSQAEDHQRTLRLWPTPRDDEIEEAVEDPESQQQEKPLPAPALARVFSRRSAASFDPGPAPGRLRYARLNHIRC